MIFRNDISMGHRRYLVLIALLAGAAAQAGPKDFPLVPPPMAQPQSFSVFRGRSVEVPLRAQGRAPGQLKFLIRSEPSKGHLGKIRVTGPKTAEVIYTHDDRSEGSDSFTFAVQAVDSPVSAAATITIAVSEEPPALSVVRSVAFGTLQVGVAREELIIVRNSGGGILAGQMEVPPPWKILGSPEYRLGRNQEMKVRILCAPEEPEDYSGKLTFSADARNSIELSVTAISPFEFEPSREIELASQDDGPLRSGAIVIRNRTSQARTVEVSVPPEIVSPDKVIVPAGGEETVALHTQSAFLGALQGTVTFESQGFKHSLPLRVFALQPILRIEPHEGLDFGEIEPRRRYKGFLRIRNEGGTDARLHVTIPHDILLVPDPNSAVLPPGETRVFEVAFETSSTRDYQSQLVIECGAAKPISVAVTGRIVSQILDGKKIPTSSLDPVARAAPTAKAQPDPALSSIPPVKDFKVLKATNRIFEIGWKKPTPEPAAWLIQQRQLEMADEGPPRAVWRDLNNVRFFEREGIAGARFENLAPGQVWFLRVVSLDEQGRRSAPSPTFMMSSAPSRSPKIVWAILSLLGIGAATIGYRKIRKRREAEALKEAEQIARIEGR
jgi:hypothetical protein